MYTHIYIYYIHSDLCPLIHQKWTIKNQLYQLEIPIHPENNVPYSRSPIFNGQIPQFLTIKSRFPIVKSLSAIEILIKPYKFPFVSPTYKPS